MKPTVMELKPSDSSSDLLVYFEAIHLNLENGGRLIDYWHHEGALMVSVEEAE